MRLGSFLIEYYSQRQWKMSQTLLSQQNLLFDLRAASILIIMKLGRDSESIASYRTFHNQTRASDVLQRRIRVVRGESKSLPPVVRSFLHQTSTKDRIERRFSQGIVALVEISLSWQKWNRRNSRAALTHLEKDTRSIYESKFFFFDFRTFAKPKFLLTAKIK